MHGGVAPGAPACALAQEQRMGSVANENFAADLMLRLRMTFQAKVGIVLGQQLAIHRTMRIVTDGATLPHGFVLENSGRGLFPMTL